MRARCWLPFAAVAALTGTGCYLPLWTGAMPPVVPRADPCGTGALTAAGRAAIQRRPYLQRARPDGVTVAWTGIPRSGPRVVVSLARDPTRTPVAEARGRYAGRAADERARRRELFAALADDGAAGLDAGVLYTLAAPIDGLAPGTAYCYQLATDRGALTDWATLMLAPAPDPERVDRFILLGDSGQGSRAQIALARRLARVPMDAMLFLGDIAYGSGTPAQLERYFFAIYADLFARVPVYAARGNHDVKTAGGRPFEEALVLPGNERWYAFDAGDVHFVVLDTTQISAAQAAWLDADLARTARQFTVVVSHHPPFTAAWRGNSGAFHRVFLPILRRHRVELVVSGHEHHYERTRVLDGITYVVSGGGGARLTPTGRRGHTAVARAVHHYVALEVHRDRLVLRAIDVDGRAIDEVVVPDRPAAPAPVARRP